MATELEGIKMARPMTHDLLRNLLGELGATVECVEITDLRTTPTSRSSTCASAIASSTIDARPSRRDQPGAAHEEPDLRRARRCSKPRASCSRWRRAKEQDLSNVSRDKWAEILEKMSPDDFKYKM